LESIVGFFMLGLGVYGFVSAMRREKKRKQDVEQQTISNYDGVELGSSPSTDGAKLDKGEASLSMADTDVMPCNKAPEGSNKNLLYVENDVEKVRLQERLAHDPMDHDSSHAHSHFLCCKTTGSDSDDQNKKATPRLVAFLIGIVHGVAGPGGVSACCDVVFRLGFHPTANVLLLRCQHLLFFDH
jgi:hypothetical protein